MAGRPRVIITGYGSWARSAINPAAAAVLALGERRRSDCDLIALEMPVETASLKSRIENLFDKHRPDIWIGVGVAVGRAQVCAEAIGINLRHFRVPDAAGVRLSNACIFKDGPMAHAADLPNAAIVEAWAEAKIPGRHSFNAGTHLCNQMLYTVRHLVVEKGLPTISGFIHVPQSPENAAMVKAPQVAPASMSLDMTVNALDSAVTCAVNAIQTATEHEHAA